MAKRELVRIADEAQNSWIVGQTFEEKEIVGPAVLVPAGEFNFEDNAIPGPIEHFVWLLPDHPIFGPIGVRDCTFRRCTFQPSVGIAGDQQLVERFLGDLLR
jgi:hypothetical protein